jgi:uncharacterized protein
VNILVNLLVGLLFGFGLLLSGMANPEKVLNFLDIAGHWDPSLAFVMGGAVIVAAIGYRLTFRRAKPLLDDSFHLPASQQVDRKLILGAAIFGGGWGLVGFCPGPALVSLTLAAPATLAFVPAMLVGAASAAWLKKSRAVPQEA